MAFRLDKPLVRPKPPRFPSIFIPSRFFRFTHLFFCYTLFVNLIHEVLSITISRR